ncbi:sulfatase [Vibrio inusitatus NBRC 102082]|uniref:Sulfatase n=1 Tax=Vibrio inusitatus NBRC 102082 TaxID=1219070 RepID=A0A4Y3HZW2_9VIBR|nr:sulfatase-like hydrolase/transferase [Vibrio inusitatus]GEA52696.1 sulfatase [Vibrio inusitatus NBRC 102082]
MQIQKLKKGIVGFSLALLGMTSVGAADIIHDAQFNVLQRQHGETWKAEDQEVDRKLAEIRKQNGDKRPNIVYILVDDLSYGQMGSRKMNHVMGVNTENINKFATEGLALERMYTEPSCTPTRAAMMTGRHPIRSGSSEVKVTLVGEGLSKDEVTIAEILSQSGYNTSHIGKWHQGDIEESYPHNQGFDFAAFPVHQQVQLALMTKEAAQANNLFGWDPTIQSNDFVIDDTFRPNGMVTGLEAHKGATAKEVEMPAGHQWSQADYHEMNVRYQAQAIEQLQQLSKSDKPFYLQYWPLYPLNFVHDQTPNKSLNGGFMAEKLQLLDTWFGEFLQEMETLGIAENTIVILMADNGLMYHYGGPSGLSQLIYRGGKTDFLEGGIRTDAYIRWPTAIEANTAAGDIFHVSDLFTTLATIGQATDYIPRDRVIDGINQTPLLLKGEFSGRRDYVYVYQGDRLAAVVKDEFKMHMPVPGMPGAAAPVYNVYRDPREENPHIGMALWSGASFQDMIKRHLMTIEKYPHLPLGKGVPYSGIDNLRPETKKLIDDFISWH